MTYRNVWQVMMVVGLCGFTALPANASSNDPATLFELFAGSYRPEAEGIENDAVYGVRLGRAVTERFEVEGAIGRFENSSSIGDDASLNADSNLVDASGVWVVPVRDKMQWLVFGGPGWAFGEAEIVVGQERFAQSTDSWSMHAGTGMRLGLTQRAHVRPEARLRWYEQSGDTDLQLTVSAGLRF